MHNVIARSDGNALLLPIHLSTDARSAWLLDPIQIESQKVVIGLGRDFPVKGERRGTGDSSPNPSGLAVAYLAACRSIPAAKEDSGLAAPDGIAPGCPGQGGVIYCFSERRSAPH